MPPCLRVPVLCLSAEDAKHAIRYALNTTLNEDLERAGNGFEPRKSCMSWCFGIHVCEM